MKSSGKVMFVISFCVLGLLPSQVEGHEAASISLHVPPNESSVGSAFMLHGFVSEGGGGLVLTIDGKTYLTPDQRRSSGDIPSGTVVAETAEGTTNVPFALPIDLNGPGVVASGQFGRVRESISSGNHEFMVCQLYGPHSGCSQKHTLNITGSVPSANTITPVGMTKPSSLRPSPLDGTTNPTPVVQSDSSHMQAKGAGVTPAALLLMLTVLGIISVIISHGFSPLPKKPSGDR